VIRLNDDIERVGYQAVNIGRFRVRADGASRQIDLPVDIPKLASSPPPWCAKQYQAFIEADADLAKSVLLRDDSREMRRRSLYALSSLLKEKAPSLPAVRNALLISANLERVGTTPPTAPKTSFSGSAAPTSPQHDQRLNPQHSPA